MCVLCTMYVRERKRSQKYKNIFIYVHTDIRTYISEHADSCSSHAWVLLFFIPSHGYYVLSIPYVLKKRKKNKCIIFSIKLSRAQGYKNWVQNNNWANWDYITNTWRCWKVIGLTKNGIWSFGTIWGTYLIMPWTFQRPPPSLYYRRHIEMEKSCTSNKEIRAKHVHTLVHIHTQSCREEANTKTASVHSDIHRCKHTDRKNTKKDTF